MTDVEFSSARQGELQEIQALLAACRLSTDWIEQLTNHCIVARVDSNIVGLVALEPGGRSGLLRFLAVAPDWRGRSLGRILFARMISHARLLGTEQLYLLTTDAEGYFASLGFERIEGSAPPIQGTAQLLPPCPRDAICMSRDISNESIHATTDLLRLRPDVPGARMWAVSLAHTMLTYFEVEPHGRFEPHTHQSEQITMVLSGELFFDVRGAIHRVGPGEVMAIPSSVPHEVWTEDFAATAVDAWSPVMNKYGQAEAQPDSTPTGDRPTEP